MGKRPKQTLLQRRHTDGQEEHEKIFNTANYLKRYLTLLSIILEVLLGLPTFVPQIPCFPISHRDGLHDKNSCPWIYLLWIHMITLDWVTDFSRWHPHKYAVLVRIERWSPRFPAPGIHSLYNPISLRDSGPVLIRWALSKEGLKVRDGRSQKDSKLKKMFSH